ncbi:MAG: DUF2855 family protein [Deltaproteobacteria bacterium]|nr:DUF2855 family protein [Deltaproteobacteria bacterium]
MATTPAADTMDFLVRRDDLHRTAFASAARPALGDGEARLAIDVFGFTANNVTYAAIGEMLRYWEFFPAADGWGRVPVWGFANVVESRHPGVAVGERVYGYLPMSTHLVVRPDHVRPDGFTDVTPHRTALPPVYNRYLRVGVPSADEPAREDGSMLLRPLFATAFLLDDLLVEQAFFGARAIALSSASSKTAIGLAALLAARADRAYRVIGLTSAGNAAFVGGLGYYDRASTYDALEGLAADEPTVFVDLAGNGAVRDAVHRRLGDRLRYSCSVGLTHHERMALPPADLPGPAPAFFFAPDRIEKRTREWGPAGLQERLDAALGRFVAESGRWMHIRRGRGPADVERVYRTVLDGRAHPADGHVLAL